MASFTTSEGDSEGNALTPGVEQEGFPGETLIREDQGDVSSSMMMGGEWGNEGSMSSVMMNGMDGGELSDGRGSGQQEELSSLMDSFMTARGVGDGNLSKTIIDFSSSTPSPDPFSNDNITPPQHNLLEIGGQSNTSSSPGRGGNAASTTGLDIGRPPLGTSSARHAPGPGSPRDDLAAFLPPDSPSRGNSMVSDDVALDAGLDSTSRLLAETEALMNDTHALTDSRLGGSNKVDAALDFFQREVAAGRPGDEAAGDETTFLAEATKERAKIDGVGAPESSESSRLSSDGSSGGAAFLRRPSSSSSSPTFLPDPEGEENGGALKKAGGDFFDPNGLSLAFAESSNSSSSPKEVRADRMMDEMPLGASIVVRSAESARTDPFSDFRRLTREQAEATGLFMSFSGNGSKHCRILETKLRQDIPTAVVQHIFQSIILSRNFVVVMKENSHTVAEDRRNNRTVAMVVGANSVKARVMLITVFFGNAGFNGTGKTKADGDEVKLEEFSSRFFNALQTSFHEENVTLSAMIRGAVCQGIGPTPTGTGLQAPATLADDYKEQLKEAFRREMRKELAAFAEPLEEYARSAEWSTALFIGALEPAFQSSGVLMPRPTRAPPLGDLPLDLHTISERRSRTAPSVDLNLPYAEQIVMLDKLLHVELNQQMKEESEVRCKRKNVHVMQRVDNCNRHRASLISLLRDSLATLGWSETQTFYDTFGIGNEAVLVAISCSMGSRIGRLYITWNHLAFYSNVLMFTKKKVVSFRDVVAVWKFDGIVGGFTVLSKTHGELSFSVPMSRDRIFEVLDFIIKMHKDMNEEENGEMAPEGVPSTPASAAPAGMSDMPPEMTNSGGGVESEQHAQWL